MSPPSIFDISRRITSAATVYPGDEALSLEPLCSIGPGCPCNILRLGNWTTHFLTHIDAPLHFIAGGASLDQLPLERFVGKSLVVAVDIDAIGPEHFPVNENLRGLNILFKTRNSALATEAPFDPNHVYLTESGAQRAVALGVNLIGIDYLSIDRYGDESYPAHTTLLGANVLILEGLNLEDIQPGTYNLSALPLKIAKADGSPVRAILTPLS